MDLTEKAGAIWEKVYPELSSGKPGLLGAAISRAEPQAMRLAIVYALLDESEQVCVQHLRAALAVWKYAEDSAKFIWGDTMGDPTADTILDALRKEKLGITRADIYEMFGRHTPKQEIERALHALQTVGATRFEKQETKGRPRERWFAV
jgi:hypothetical protein